MESSFLSSVTLRNYKSIAACRVRLPRLAFFVGVNGSGKSNFLDSLRFVSEALTTSLDHALRDRGTIKEVRRRSGGHPNHFSVRLEFNLPDGREGHFSFRIGAKPSAGFEVQHEECVIQGQFGQQKHFYHVQSGQVVEASFQLRPASLPDRLFLVALSGLPEFRPVYDALSRIEVYNLNPKEIAAMQKPDAGDLLRRDGSNLASVFHHLSDHSRNRVNEYLSRIVRDISSVEAKTLGSQETLEFRQKVSGQRHPWRFLAASMSDGTLRACGILAAVFQTMRESPVRPLMIGLEEPEMALHPAAASVLLAALREGARECQILVTSHSPDLLDNSDISPDSLFAVDSVDGVTRIAGVDAVGRQMIKDRLFTPGELLRQNQISPANDGVFDIKDERQLGLFDIFKSIQG